MRNLAISLVIILFLLTCAADASAEEKIAVWCLAPSVPECNFLVDGVHQSIRDENRFLVQYGGVVKQMAEQKGISLSTLQNKEEAIAAARALEINAILLLLLETIERENFTLHVQAEFIPISSKSIHPRKIEGLVVDNNDKVLHHFGYGLSVLAFRKKVEITSGLPDEAPRAVKDLRDRYFRWPRGEATPPAFVLFYIDEKGQIRFISQAGSYEKKLVNFVKITIKKDCAWESAKQAENPLAVYGLVKMDFHRVTKGEEIKKEEARKEAKEKHEEKGLEPGGWLKINQKVDGVLIVTE